MTAGCWLPRGRPTLERCSLFVLDAAGAAGGSSSGPAAKPRDVGDGLVAARCVYRQLPAGAAGGGGATARYAAVGGCLDTYLRQG